MQVQARQMFDDMRDRLTEMTKKADDLATAQAHMDETLASVHGKVTDVNDNMEQLKGQVRSSPAADCVWRHCYAM